MDRRRTEKPPKMCSVCGVVQLVNRRFKYCDDCYPAVRREQTNGAVRRLRGGDGREAYNTYAREWRLRNPTAYNAGVRRRRLKRYGITAEEYEALLAKQDGRCAICEAEEAGGRTGGWHIDHDHDCCPGRSGCGKCVRGLLCHRCNLAIGLFDDDQTVLGQALAYLKGARHG